MKYFVSVSIAAGLLLASCSGHGSSTIPQVGSNPQSAMAGGSRTMSTTATAPAGWAATNTQAIPVKNATDAGVLSPSKAMNVTVVLGMHNQPALAKIVASGQMLSDGALAPYRPTASEVSSVTSYLQSKGFTNVTALPDNTMVQATGTAAQVSSAFNTSIHSYNGGGTAFFANTTPAYVPTSLGGTVVAVMGLNNLQSMKPTPQVTSCGVEGVATPPQACLRFYDPATYAVAYDIGSVPPASNTSIAIMSEGNPAQAISDLRLNEQKFGMPQVPVNRVQVGLPSSDTGGNGEWTLDMTYSTAMAGNVKALWLYTTTSMTDQDIALMYNKWMTQHYANTGNSSFGGCEFGPYIDGSMVAMDQILLEAAAKGMTMFVSTGDNGSFCNNFVDTNGAPGGAPFVEYPAASPYVVAVGGTDLFTAADGTYQGESPWEAGGGGVSQFEYSPYWETGVQPVDKAGSFRGLPDVSMDASLETGAELWGGQAANGSCTPCVTGGTSLASPLMAGTWARLEGTHHANLGFAAPRLYHNFTANAAGSPNQGPPAWQADGGFHDILTGGNGAFTALPGYDYASGLGSVDVSLLNSGI